MDPMMIVLGPPIWVWPLLALLLWAGVQALRERTVPVAAVYSTPFVGLLSFFALRRMGPPDVVWTIYGLALAAGITLGFLLQTRWLLRHDGARVTLRGEWISLTTMMIAFWTNFGAGVVRNRAPELYANLTFDLAFAGVVGVVSGIFLGRALYVLAVSLRTRRMAPSVVETGGSV